MPRGVYERKPRPHTSDASPKETGPDLPVSSGGGILKVHIWPHFEGEDKGDGGVRRVVEAQKRYLPQFGIQIVNTPEEADVIACHMEMPKPWYNLYPDKPVVAHCHGLYWDDFQWDNWAIAANEKVMNLLRTADAITAPSDWVANAISRATSRPAITVHHGVDSAEWDAADDNLGYVLWNKTRPDPVCDPEPFNQVSKLLPEVQFVSTFGEDAPNVTVTGKVPYEQAKKIVQRAGVYLATSKETFGIGTLEAMAAGVPIVGFAWGGQVDIVRDKIDGFLVRPGDIHSLSLAIQGAILDRVPLGENAKQRAAEFTWEKAAKQYADIYKATYAKATEPRPRTSIIVTNYNLDEYLDECLTSVADQTDKNWECIIVDDASSRPAGRAIALNWASSDSRFKLVQNEKNLYLAEARNVGIRVATGRYILPLDADDKLEPSTVATLADALDGDRNTHVAYGGVRFVNEDGKTPTVYEGYPPGSSSWPYQFSYENQMRQRNLLPYCSMFRREVWLDTGGYRPRCRTAEDADFWSRVSSYGFRPNMVTSEPTLIYRNRADSMSRKQEPVDWIKWFPWARDLKLAPAGAVTQVQQPVPSFDRPIISVIIPCGPDHRILVKDAVDSVDAQSFRDWECIVVNDSGARLPELPSWVRIIDTEGKIGVAAARNLGVRMSKSPLFLPLDADDFLQPNALQWLFDAYRESRDIIYSDFWEDPKDPGVFSVYRLPDYDAHNLIKGTIHCVTALTPKSAWERVGGYDEQIPAWEDWDFQLKCADAGICSRRIAAPLWVYRKHTGVRRNANVQDFETSKNGILSKWSLLWSGGKELMACSSCAARATVRPGSGGQPMTQAQVVARMAPNGEALLVEYTGDRRGNMPYKGKGGNFYIFAAGEPPRYVLAVDLHLFEGRDDFRILPKEIVPALSETAVAPVLTAPGRPA
jgi:glycosyltransferase involved in cell wall biosynthesis